MGEKNYCFTQQKVLFWIWQPWAAVEADGISIFKKESDVH